MTILKTIPISFDGCIQMTKVKFADLRPSALGIEGCISEAVSRVISSGVYIGGSEVDRFEESFGRYVGGVFCAGVGNGLDAITLCLRALDVGVGDEVIVPANTYIATWMAISRVGATIIPVEPRVRDAQLDVEKLEQQISDKTKCIIVVHLYGHITDMASVLAIANKYGLRVIEDAAQAHGAKYRGDMVGSFPSDAVAWSFYPGKNLGAFGDAGAVTSRSQQLINRLKTLRNYGSSVKYENIEIGYNSRLDPLQAAILTVKLRSLDGWNSRRRCIADYYDTMLGNCPLRVLKPSHDVTSAYHLYPICVAPDDRDSLQKYLENLGIETLVHYPIPPHKQMAYRDSMPDATFRITEDLCQQMISLPIGPHLSDLEVDYVVSSIKSYYDNLGNK